MVTCPEPRPLIGRYVTIQQTGGTNHPIGEVYVQGAPTMGQYSELAARICFTYGIAIDATGMLKLKLTLLCSKAF